MDDLIKRIKEECAGRDRWYVMNATEDGYCIDFDRERDADRWVADRLRENPGYMERNGYHVVKRRSFTSAEELANEAAARLTALESERDALLAAAGKEAVPIGYVQASALPLLKRGAADTIFGDCHECADVPLYTAPAADLGNGDGRDAWQPIESAPEGKLLVVSWLDKDDPENPERHAFDFIEDDGWVHHNEDYDHFLCVAPPGSRGPSADAPYTHWMALPDVPAALSQKAEEQQ